MFVKCVKDAIVRGRRVRWVRGLSCPDWLRTWSFGITRGGDANL